MPNPLVTTPMVWDPDINPEGLAEQWKHTFDFSFGGGEAPAAAEKLRQRRRKKASMHAGASRAVQVEARSLPPSLP